MSRSSRRKIASRASAVVLLATVSPVYAGVTISSVSMGSAAGSANWAGSPILMTAQPTNGTVAAWVPENFDGNGGNRVVAQTFVPSTTFTLDQISIFSSGGGGTGAEPLKIRLYDLGTPADTGYTPGTNVDLFNSGAGLNYLVGATSNSRIVNMTFDGSDQVVLQAGRRYAFEIQGNPNTNIGADHWLRSSGATGNPYADGNGFFSADAGVDTVRGHISGGSRDMFMALYAATKPNAFLKVDINGGPANHLRPNQAGWSAFGNPDVLPVSGGGASPDPDGGYGTHTVSRSYANSSVTSGTVNLVLRSVNWDNGAYADNGAVVNSRDIFLSADSTPTNGGNLTKAEVYRDYVVAEAGSVTVSNGTNHRMEVTIDGLNPNTPYDVTFYAFDNANRHSAYVFTDVTDMPLTFIPPAFASGGTFNPGDGSGGTQYAPTGQYSYGTGSVTSDSERSVVFTATSDANGKLIFAETTVVGLPSSGLPVLNGVELALGARSWNGNSSGTWSSASNWVSGFVPNGLGASANFGSGTANTNITVDAPVQLGRMNFSGSAITIGGTGTITLIDSSINSTLSGSKTGRTQINVVTGSANQTISAPLVLARDTAVYVSSTAQTLSLTNLQPFSAILSKNGPGTLAVNNLRGNRMDVTGGTVSVQAGRSLAGTSKVNSVNFFGGSFNLADQDLVIDYATTSPLAGVKAALLSAYASGSWNGTGLTSSAATAAAASANKTALGYGEAAALGLSGSFSGQSFTGDAVLVRYTYAGDATLDGKVNTQDFNMLAGGFGSGTVWTAGDFNYDSAVTSADFALLAANYGLSIAPPAGAALGAVVPEPTTLSLLAMGAVGLLGRRRQ